MPLLTRIQALFSAQESTYGSPGSNGFPDISGLTFAAAEFDSGTGRFDQITPREVERTQAGSEFYERAKEIEKWCAANDTHLHAGKVSVTYWLRTGGDFSTFADYDAIPLFQGIGSSMCVLTPPAASETAAAGVSTTRFTPTTAGDYAAGGLLRVTKTGRAEYTQVTKVDAVTPLIHHSPDLTAAITTDTVHRLATFYAAAKGSVGASLALVMDGDGTRVAGVGVRAETIRIRPEGRAVKVEITYDVPLAIIDHSASILTYPASVTDSAEATVADGQVAHMNQAYVVLSNSDTAIATAPAELTRKQLNVEPWEVTITNTLTKVGQTHTALGAAACEVTDSKIEASFSLMDPDTTLNADYPDVRRHVLAGMSACGSSDGAGNGAVVCIPSGVLKQDPRIYDQSGELIGQKLVYAAGRADNIHDSSTLPAGAPFSLGFGL